MTGKTICLCSAMMMPCMCKKVVVFDLDDTLYKEIDFLKSGYRKVSELVEKLYGLDSLQIYNQLISWYNDGENAFFRLNEQYGLENSIEDYLNVYRYHHPLLTLSDETVKMLNVLKGKETTCGIITDGRKITQKHKIEALGLEEWISWDYIVINEENNHFKPNHWSFDRMMLHCFGQNSGNNIRFYYVGDNPEKDFLAPNQLGWTTICLIDNGRNIHKQKFDLSDELLPQYRITGIDDLTKLI